jgi:hypothetical protein
MEHALFTRLWQEVDFDDHPPSGGHGPEPEGELRFTSTPRCLRVEDDRLSFLLGEGEDADSVHRWCATSVKLNEGPDRLGEHRWSLAPNNVDADLGDWISVHLSVEERGGTSVEPERTLLSRIRETLQPLLPDWTWHLEVDNKADRMGWYVRAPAAWTSLFTIFVGLGWNDREEKRGFLLFERAPPGELDRPDEAEPNRLDGLRTVALCNAARGGLSLLAQDMHWAAHPHPHPLDNLPGTVHLWPPSMGRWPLLLARSDSTEDVVEWSEAIVTALLPAISTLSTKIEGLSWH